MTEPTHTDAVVDPESRAALLKYFEEHGACDHCGYLHLHACPRVRELRFHPDGRLAVVKFFEVWSRAGCVDVADILDDETDA